MKKIPLISFVLFLIIVINACSFSITTANFTNIQVATQVDSSNRPIKTTNVLATDSEMIYVTGTLKNAPEGTVIKALWIYHTESDESIDIDSASLDIKDSTTDFSFSLSIPDSGWPIGKYEVKLFIDEKYKQSVYFEVK